MPRAPRTFRWKVRAAAPNGRSATCAPGLKASNNQRPRWNTRNRATDPAFTSLWSCRARRAAPCYQHTQRRTVVHQVWIRGLVPWCDPRRLLGPGEWRIEAGSASATLSTHDAADLDARLRGFGVGGGAFEFTAVPPLSRSAVRAARTTDARRRRETTPGFTRAGTRLDAEGKVSLTPEALALAVGERAAGRSVVDAGCGAGGSAIGFARAGCAVVAIEQDARRLADAAHNARVYGVAGSIRFVHAPIARALPDLRADILFVDPPWGIDWSRRGVSLADLPLLAEVLAMPRHQFAETWLKVPPSFDVRGVPGAKAEAWYGLAAGDNRRVKFVLLRVASGS